MSKIKVNEIEKVSGSGITVPTGTSFTVTDGMAASTISSGTLADARIPNLNASKINAGTLPIARGGTGLTSLGSAGQALKVNSGGNALEFGAVAGGKVLQVVQAKKTSEGNTNSTSFVATGLAVNITPSATSSKVLVMAANAVYINSGSQWGENTIYRDSTNLSANTSFGGLRNNSTATGAILTMNILDEPNTTSQITYQVYHKSTNSGTHMYSAINNWNSTIIAMEIGA